MVSFRNNEIYAIAKAQKPMDLEIRKLINTPPVT